ncbi:DUF6086 family protein [Streptomyces sp. NBC_01077]|uniref:DUF6086 family protein n=1 Tax=Streptomyces sp. NBC_01077 TaxID=2903746 RepID=UPI0038703096|nr:DUF6086 family protein [Streptomyces sp. NBC_01077]
MSQYFKAGDRYLWNPSNGAAVMFQRQVALYEAELDLPSGIEPMQDNDEARIDLVVFETFVNALVTRYAGMNHTVIHALSEGFAAMAVALAAHAGIRVDWARPGPTPGTLPEGEAWAERVREKARDLDRCMDR